MNTACRPPPNAPPFHPRGDDIPVFARPEGALSYEQKMAILAEATAQTRPDDFTVTSWLVIVAELPEKLA